MADWGTRWAGWTGLRLSISRQRVLGMSMQGDTARAGDRQGLVNLSQRGHAGKKGREEAGRSLLSVLSLLGLHTDVHFLHRQARDLALLSNLVEEVAESCCLPPPPVRGKANAKALCLHAVLFLKSWLPGAGPGSHSPAVACHWPHKEATSVLA